MSKENTVTVLSQANKALSKTATDLNKVMTNLVGLVETSANVAETIELQQAELDNLEQRMSDDFRGATAELDIKVLENERSVLDTLLEKFSLADITKSDLRLIKISLDEACEDNAATIEKAVAAASSLLHAKHGGELSTLKSDHKVAVAEKDANVNSLGVQITFLEKTIVTLEATIVSEREARVRIAEAEAKKAGLTVNTSAK